MAEWWVAATVELSAVTMASYLVFARVELKVAKLAKKKVVRWVAWLVGK